MTSRNAVDDARATVNEIGATSSAATAHSRNLQPTRVDSSKALLLGLFLTAVFYSLLVYPARRTHFGQIFLERGWVTPIEALLACWSVAFLICKAQALRLQGAWQSWAIRQLSARQTISQADARSVSIVFCKHDPSQGSGLLARRIQQALALFHAHGDRREVETLLTALSDSDANGTESSYTMLKVMIWAIPIIGFIGTVIGLGSAVGGFAGSLASAGPSVDPAKALLDLKASLNHVTSGLSIAFDATFAALTASVLIMFPASWIENAEGELLARTDTHSLQDLLPLLNDEGDGAGAGVMIADLVSRAVEPHRVALDRWQLVVLDAGRGIADQLVARVSSISTLSSNLQGLKTSLQQHAEAVGLVEQGRSDSIGKAEKTLQAGILGISEDWNRNIKNMERELEAAHETVQSAMTALADSLVGHRAQLRKALAAASERSGGVRATASEELRQEEVKWSRSLEMANDALANAIGAMAESIEREQRQSVADLEALLARVRPLTAAPDGGRPN